MPGAIAQAINSNPQIRETSAKADAAEARAKAQREKLLPEVRANGQSGVKQRNLPAKVETRHPFAYAVLMNMPPPTSARQLANDLR